jgi:hypothetical protein
VCLFLAGLPLCAGQIPVVNYSFEDSLPGFGNPNGWTLFDSTTSPTFTDNVRTVVNNGSVYPTVSGATGSQFAAVNLDHNYLTPPTYATPVIPPDGSLDGLVSDSVGVFAADTVYTLSASVGLSQALDSLDVGLALGTGSPTLADVYPAPADPQFAYLLINGSQLSDEALVIATVTLDTAAFSSLVGQPINISLIFHSTYEYGRQAFLDDVTLSSASDMPEPSTICLASPAVAIGLAWAASGAARRLRIA